MRQRLRIDLAAALATAPSESGTELTFAELARAYDLAALDGSDLRLRKWVDAFGQRSAWSLTAEELASAAQAMLEHGYAPAPEGDPGHGGEVARAVHRAALGWPVRRCSPRQAPHDRRRACGAVDQDDAAHKARQRACKPRHRHQEFLSFLREIDKAVAAELDIHCIADNYATHNHPKIKAWLAAPPRWHIHFIPTYRSWLNQVERFFSLITDKAVRRGSFTSVKQLVQRIDHFVAAYNTNCQPFKWTATADSILEKLHRLCPRITGTGH